MKIHFEHKSTVFEFEQPPMTQERFAVLCKLAGGAIAGGVLVALVYMEGIWPIVWAVGALVLVGLYRMMVEGFK